MGLSGCLSSLTGGTSEPVKIGFASALSGPYSAEATQQKQAAELAVKELNEDGGILGRDVELVVRDTELSGDTAARRVSDLINNEDIDMLTGSISGGIIIVFNSLAKEAGIPLFAGPTGMRALRKEGNYYEGTFAKFCATHQYARAIPEFVKNDLGASTVFGMYADYAWGQEVWGLASDWYDEVGVSVADTTKHPVGHSDFAPQINAARESGADVVHVTNFGTDTSNSLKQMREFDLGEDMDILFSMSARSIAQRAGTDLWEDIHVGMQWHPDLDTSGANDFSSKLQDEYGTRGDAYHETVYAGVHEFARGAEAGGSVSTEDVASALEGDSQFSYAKGEEQWRNCDNQSVQPFILLKGKAPSDQQYDGDIFDIASQVGGTELLPDCSYVGWS